MFLTCYLVGMLRHAAYIASKTGKASTYDRRKKGGYIMLDYNKFKNSLNGLIYIVEGHDFYDACVRSNKITTKENQQFLGYLIQTPVNSEAGMKFFSDADVVVNIEN